MDIYSNNVDDFNNFNDFFIRKLKDDARIIDKNNNIVVSPGDGRLFAYENISVNNLVLCFSRVLCDTPSSSSLALQV